jgi:hypothetical protein
MEWIVCTIVFFAVMIIDKRKIVDLENKEEMVENA